MFSIKIKEVKIANSVTELEEKLLGLEMRSMTINSKQVLLIKHKNKFHLVKNKCPHQGVKLETGKCTDGKIICQWHRYAFDLETGLGGGLHLENYPIEVRDNGVYASFEYFSWFGE